MVDADRRLTTGHHLFSRVPGRLGICALTVLLTVPLATAQSYNVIDLGAYPGGSDSEGFAINALGQVVGYSDFGGSSSHAACGAHAGA